MSTTDELLAAGIARTRTLLANNGNHPDGSRYAKDMRSILAALGAGPTVCDGCDWHSERCGHHDDCCCAACPSIPKETD